MNQMFSRRIVAVVVPFGLVPASTWAAHPEVIVTAAEHDEPVPKPDDVD